MIVAILSDKGGTGKTTLATNLAGMCSVKSQSVLLIDADRQGSALYWARSRKGLKGYTPNVPTSHLLGRDFTRSLTRLARKYEHVIIDIGVFADDETNAALSMAECVIVPLQPSGVDVWAMALPDELVAREMQWRADRPRKLRAFALLNRVSPQSYSEDMARDALDECAALVVADVTVSDRIVFQRALASGRTAHEWRPIDRAARDEMESVYELVFDRPYRRMVQSSLSDLPTFDNPTGETQ